MYLLQRLRSRRKSWINIQRRRASATRVDAEEVAFGNTEDMANGKCHPSHKTTTMMMMRTKRTTIYTKSDKRRGTNKKNARNAIGAAGKEKCGDNGESSNASGRNTQGTIQDTIQSHVLLAITGANHISRGHNSSTVHSHHVSHNVHTSRKGTG
jgi:hypothetical protein